MVGPEQDDVSLNGNSALAELPPAAKRSAQPISGLAPPEGDAEDLDLQDQSKILFGAQAISGKALMAGRADAQIAEDITRRKLAEQTQHEQARVEEARQLANLAAWNKQYEIVGGVRMTNEEAQAARQKFIDNADVYADQAVDAGLIRPDQKDALEAWARRKHELEDRKGRGIITDAETKELQAGDQSGIGKSFDKITGDLASGTSISADAKVRSAVADKSWSARSVTASGVEDKFTSAPAVKVEFASRSEPVQPAAATPATPTPSKKVEATGLDL